MPDVAVVRALLDRPSPRSLGMLGLVVESAGGAEGRLRTDGVLGSQAGLVEQGELADLVGAGQALAVDGLEVRRTRNEPMAALWVGDEFAAGSEDRGLPLPPFPKSRRGRASGGTYWVSSAAHVHRVLDTWVARAFRRAALTRDHRLATLLSWAAPDQDEARAAAWLTAESQAKRERDLTWWARLASGGRAAVAPAILADRYRRLVGRAADHLPAAIGFTAWAKGGDGEIAGFVANRLGIPIVSFGGWLRDQLRAEGREPTRPLLQQLGKQVLDDLGPLGFCLEVLARLPTRLSETGFVIDGIRHDEVLNVLRFLAGDDRFKLASVHRPDPVRRELLMREDGVAAESVDRVMHDETEQEIELVGRRAKFRLDRELGVEQEGQRVVQELVPA